VIQSPLYCTQLAGAQPIACGFGRNIFSSLTCVVPLGEDKKTIWENDKINIMNPHGNGWQRGSVGIQWETHLYLVLLCGSMVWYTPHWMPFLLTSLFKYAFLLTTWQKGIEDKQSKAKDEIKNQGECISLCLKMESWKFDDPVDIGAVQSCTKAQVVQLIKFCIKMRIVLGQVGWLALLQEAFQGPSTPITPLYHHTTHSLLSI
jgi:hypothetical protein